ncbi:MAG: STAS domain-containing protein [Bacteriovoracaceae bacterium]|jgi:hypothetical protein|nr:STAS domain-containing protein [Bacteriovoracaceae bacterium]
MKIDTIYKDGETKVEVYGAIDSYTYPIFAKEINTLVRTGVTNLSINFSKCSKINVPTIKLIVRIENKISSRNGILNVISIGKKEAELLSLMKLEAFNNESQV